MYIRPALIRRMQAVRYIVNPSWLKSRKEDSKKNKTPALKAIIDFFISHPARREAKAPH
ncbi:hypothetical protein OS42_45980 [Dickeya oryzae]